MAKDFYQMTYNEYLDACDVLATKGGAFAASHDREDHDTNLACWMFEIEEAIEGDEDDIPDFTGHLEPPSARAFPRMLLASNQTWHHTPRGPPHTPAAAVTAAGCATPPSARAGAARSATPGHRTRAASPRPSRR